MSYVIEGSVSEVTVSKNESKTVSFCIIGTEGYSIKQDKEKYNVFCLKNELGYDKVQQCYIVGQKILFIVSDFYENLLLQASEHGKRIRFSVSEEPLKSYKNKDDNSVTFESDVSITLLSN